MTPPLRLLIALALAPLPGQAAEKTAPNIVLIIADDLGWADLACYGSRFHQTPHLDRLAREGMRFTHAYAASPLCMPSRAAIHTGRHPARLGLTDVNPGRIFPHEKLLPPKWALRLEPAEVTLAEILRDHGHTAASIGKWHLGHSEASATGQGFQSNLGGTLLGYPPSYFSPYRNRNLPDGPAGEHLDARLGHEAAKFITENRSRPFFLHLSHFAVHLPIQPRPDLLAKYEARLRDTPSGGAQKNPHYAAMIESLDQSIGTVLDALQAAGIEDKTLVIFTSDNGGLATEEGPHTPATSNAPLRSGKGHLHEGGIRVPLIVRWPGVTPPAAVCEQPVIGTDLFHTLRALTGTAPPDAAADGLSLLPVLKDPAARLPLRALHWHFPHYARQHSEPSSAVRTGDYKLIEFYADKRHELYDLSRDPAEAHNLAATQPAKLAELRHQLDQWRTSIGARPPTPNPAHDPAQPRRGEHWGTEPPPSAPKVEK